MKKIEIEIPDNCFFDKETMSVKECPKQTFEYVDLGLPSGTLWATCNVGAKSDIDFGDYLSFEEAQEFNCPTKEQIVELIEYTTSLWINKEGVNGLLFIGQNQKYIFLHASGYRWNTDICHVGDYGTTGRVRLACTAPTTRTACTSARDASIGTIAPATPCSQCVQ